ncbi:MAG: RNA-binding transcriptional accessory protein [Cytophagales bacterium]|nr:MAG: RNA-binding transcriptional accessory protein [Cytophagales bacterium]
MSSIHFSKIANLLGISERQVAATVNLLDGGATVPFLARYRKEVTGGLDEVAIAQIRDRIHQLRELDKRREAILKSIEEQGKLTPELAQQIADAETMSVLEDLYLPYKPKRRTRATIAKEKGLEPLAELLFTQGKINILQEAQKYISQEKGVLNEEEALAGARDIIAEKVNEDTQARATMRETFWKKGTYTCKVIKGKEKEAQKYKDYFEWSESVLNAPSHRVLAMRRGEAEMVLSLDLAPDEEMSIEQLEALFVKGNQESSQQVKMAVQDAYKRLLKPSMETEIRLLSKQKAEEEAIKVFSKNLRELLLAAPLGQKNILAIDPGIRTGCKVVCLDKQGKLLAHEVIFPDRRATEAAATIKDLVKQYQIEAIAVGNGTASRETETFIKKIGLPKEILLVMVNESGASIYSASEVAREEFPDYDITVRGAISIGRRLSDPLAELVKIDPKSIGVGQYQHDVDQNDLKRSLDEVVMSCVNAVGVELNTASKQLLTYVSGVGPQLAQNIIDYRNKNGAFRSREDLKRVPRLGDKAYEQCAGFLRIRNADNPLDTSAVHPESYNIVAKMTQDLQCEIKDLMTNETLRKKIDLKKYVTEQVGLPTLQDILDELAKPGRDPREQFESFEFAEGINEIDDVKAGMQLNGIVTNVTNFGAFVDIGVHVNGLIHISNMGQYVKDPNEILKVGQKIVATVVEVDIERKRIALSLGNSFKKQATDHNKKEKQTANTSQKSSSKDDWQNQLEALKGKFR